MDRACCCFTASKSKSRARSHDPLQRIIGIGKGIILLFLFVNSRKIVEDFILDLRQKTKLVKILADKSLKPPLPITAPWFIHGSSMDTKGHFATLLRNQQEGLFCMTSGLHETKRILFFNIFQCQWLHFIFLFWLGPCPCACCCPNKKRLESP